MGQNLYSWTEIRGQFKTTLILGNGGSIAVHDRFSYGSLYEEASKAVLLSDPIQKLFDRYDTTDFEFVLRMVWRAHQVNSFLGVKDEAVEKAYYEIRESLIKTVEGVHIEYSKAVNCLPSIAGFLSQFKTVVSLNYDLLVYWAMLYGNNLLGASWFKDGFIHKDRTFENDFEFLRQPHGKARGATLVFYLHGNLVLATNFYGQETKISSDEKADLLETIVKRWALDDSTPLFVSEGSSAQKYQAILRNGYLRTVYNEVLRKRSKDESICIYGWSMSDQDTHLLEAIGKNQPKYLAISVHTRSDVWVGFCDHVRARLDKIHGLKKTEILFFDSASDGCWIKSKPIGE